MGTRKQRLATLIVRLAAWPINQAYCQGQVKGRKRLERMFGWVMRRITNPLLKLALLADKEAAVTQMVNEGWWG